METEKLYCSCGGEVKKGEPLSVRTGAETNSAFVVCSHFCCKCHKMYDDEKNPLRGKGENHCFLQNGHCVVKDEKGQFAGTYPAFPA